MRVKSSCLGLSGRGRGKGVLWISLFLANGAAVLLVRPVDTSRDAANAGDETLRPGLFERICTFAELQCKPIKQIPSFDHQHLFYSHPETYAQRCGGCLPPSSAEPAIARGVGAHLEAMHRWAQPGYLARKFAGSTPAIVLKGDACGLYVARGSDNFEKDPFARFEDDVPALVFGQGKLPAGDAYAYGGQIDITQPPLDVLLADLDPLPAFMQAPPPAAVGSASERCASGLGECVMPLSNHTMRLTVWAANGCGAIDTGLHDDTNGGAFILQVGRQVGRPARPRSRRRFRRHGWHSGWARPTDLPWRAPLVS